MYTKLYRGIVDGSLYGRREALTVFFVMLALADEQGVVDVLPKKIADILGESDDFVANGLAELSAPDPISRTPTAEGRRILPLNEHRNWGWKITNYEAYRKIRDEEQRREYQRQWDRSKRKRPTTNPTASDKSDHVRPKTTHTEAETDTHTEAEKKNTTAAVPPIEFEDLRRIYPKRAGDQGWSKALKACGARLKEGYSWQEIIAGAERYAIFCRATGKVGTEFAKQAATFVGPEKHFLQPWGLPANKAEVTRNQNVDASLQWLAEQEQNDATQ